MRTRRQRSWIVAAALGALVHVGVTARAEADERLAAPAPEIDDEPAALDGMPPSFDDERPGPRRKRPREPYQADDVSPYARNGLALTGTVVAAGAWFSGIFVLGPQGFPNHGWPMLIPVAGPWITLGIREEIPGVSNEDAKRGFIAADGVIQGAGLAMLVVGQFLPVTDPMHSGGDYLHEGAARRPPSPPPRFAVAPAGAGLRAYGSF